ncbi:hypothetical protein NYF14_10710 [Sphingobium sp. 10 DY56-G10]
MSHRSLMTLHAITQRIGFVPLSLLSALVLSRFPAHACSYPRIEKSPARIRQAAQSAFSKADSVVDAEVISPMTFGSAWKEGLTPMAMLKVLNTWKGPHNKGEFIFVIYLSSCDIGLPNAGEKIRVVLSGGHDMYRAELRANGYGYAQRPYNVEIDRLVRRVRPAYISAYPGMQK